MKEIVLLICGENVTKFELEEGFQPCPKGKSVVNLKCPFCYVDNWGHGCCPVRKKCPFIKREAEMRELYNENDIFLKRGIKND